MKAKPFPSCRRLAAALFVTLWALLLGNPANAATSASPLALRCPTNIVLWTCTSNAVLQFPPPVATGGCSNYQLVCSPPQGTILPLGTTPVTCRVFDACQNSDSCTFLVTVRMDTEPPVIQCPSNITTTACLNPAGVCGKPVFYPPPVAVDNSGSVAVVCAPPSGSFFPCGNTPVTCTAQDRCENKDACRFIVSVLQGGEPPTIQCPPDRVLTTCSNSVVLTYPLPPVTPAGTTVSCVPPPGTQVPLGTTTVTCTASNDCGSASCHFDVVVRPVPPPGIQCPTAPIVAVVPCGSNCVPVFYPDPVVSNGKLVGCNPPSGTCLPVGNHLVVCRAVNDCGVLAGCEFNVTVVQGQGEPPRIQCPNDLVLTTCSNCASLTPTTFPLPGVINGTLLGCNPPLGTCFPLGTTTVTCIATNPCGRAECTFRITVRPVPPPSIQCPTNPIVFTVPCGSNCVPVLYPDPVVVNGTLVGCNPPSGTCLPVGVHVVICRATNDCGDVASCEFIIRVLAGDGQPPRIVCPSNIVAWTCGSNSVPVNYPPPTVFPGSDPSPIVDCVPPAGSAFPPGVTVVTCTVKDHCGNENKCEFTVTVRRDVTPPTLDCPSNIVVCVPTTVNCRPVNYTVLVSDDTDPTPTVVCNPPSGTCFPLGTTTVICRAVDKCGNESKCAFTVSVLPDRAPVLTVTKDHGFIVVCWTKVCHCVKLQGTRSLSRPIVWIDVDLEPEDHGTEYCVRLPASIGIRFFRLVPCDQPTAPIYGVKGSGLTADQAGRLAAALDLSRDQVHFDAGALLFLDPVNFQAIPTQGVQDPAIIERLKAGSQDNPGDLAFEAINFEKLRALQTVPGDEAIALFERALKQADLLPDNGEPSANHSMFEAVDPSGRAMLDSMAIDTHVNFHFNLGGIPLIGPGAKLSLALGPNGKPTALHFATRQLEPIQDVPILPLDEAVRRCGKLYPKLQPSGAPRLMYYAPSLTLPAVQKVIPCFECGGDAMVGDQQVSLLRSLIPATDDPALVPSLVLRASAQDNSISARATVDGGTPPYSYQWVSSSADLSSAPSGAASIEYLATPRGGETTETIRVIVTDANGVVVQDSESLHILGGPDTNPGFFAAVGGVNDYGTERAVSNMGAAQQSGFNARFDSDGVTRRFNWTGINAWEKDFKEGGSSLDYLYVDNADIVFYIGHGNGGGFTFESNHDDGNLTYTDAAGAWGDIDLEWLALLSCEVLKADYGGQRWWQRWGPSFDGLHLLLGFETNAHDWPAFGGTFADWTLGKHIGPFILPAMPVRLSWFLAKAEQQPAADIAVAMGVIGPAGLSNYNDYFWGKGPVGPDVRGGDIHGYWRVTFQ